MIRALIAAALLTITPPPVDGNDSWAGIEDNTNAATRAMVEFVVPPTDGHCGTGATSNAAVWVGIGGIYGNAFAQLGVTLAPEGRGAWYELFDHQNRGPVVDVPIDISVGDKMRIRLAFSDDHSTLVLVWLNLTTGERQERDIDHAARFWSGTSVEWIIERTRATLADFGSLTFTEAHYTDGTVHDLSPADYEAAILAGPNYGRRVTRTTVDGPASATVQWLRCGG